MVVSALRRYLRVLGPLGSLGLGLLVILGTTAIFAPLLARHNPLATTGLPYHGPNASYWLGTDDVGHDLFAQLVYGARISLTIGVLAALVALFVGLLVALLGGYLRGRVELVLMRLVDLMLALPFFVVVIVLAAFFGRGLWTTVIVIGALIWAQPARVLRSQVVKIREFQHVVAAQAMGASPWRVITRHILPRLAPLAVSQFVRAANISILIESALAFLGLGNPNEVSWGSMLFFANSRSAFLTNAWIRWILPPGLALSAAVIGFAFVGYAIEEWADPRLSRASARITAPRKFDAPVEATQSPGTALEVRDLTVEYSGAQGRVRAVDGVSFNLHSGQIVGLVGESGSGKSTTAMALLRLIRSPGRIVAGEIMLSGRDLRALPAAEITKARGREIALIPQGSMNSLNPAYTVQHQVAEAAALLPRPMKEADARAVELLGLVGIPAKRHGAYPHEFSGGMRQRVVVAMALANQPRVVVADEPVTGLDVITQAAIIQLLEELGRQFDFALLFISHDLPLVARIAQELMVMCDGRIIERGPVSTITEHPEHAYTRSLLTPLDIDRRALTHAQKDDLQSF